MYVCLCKGITDAQIRNAVEGGATSMRAVRQQLGVMSQCGKCACDTKDIIQSVQTHMQANSPRLWSAA